MGNTKGKENGRNKFQGTRYFPGGVSRSNDTWITGLNNNDLLIGPSGAGKTRNYVIPNILNSNESFILTDTKGMVYDLTAETLRKRGFTVEKIDFVNPEKSTVGYNPLKYIRRHEHGRPNEQDIVKIASMICPEEGHSSEPFWPRAAQGALASIIAFVMEAMPKDMQNLKTVAELARCFDDDHMGEHPEELLDKVFDVTNDFYLHNRFCAEMGDTVDGLRGGCRRCLKASSYSFRRLIDSYNTVHEDSMSQRLFDLAYGNAANAEKMAASIAGIVGAEVRGFTYDEIAGVFEMENTLDFADLGKKKTAVFVTVSDTDRSVDKVLNMFYSQAFNILCESADNDYETHYLDVPVRIYLDDFATNVTIPDFDKIISVIRSREIYTSVVLQSLSQLEAMYGSAKAATILNNCSTCAYLGGRDISTVSYVGYIANKSEHTIMSMPKGKYYLITTGEEAQLLDFTPAK